MASFITVCSVCAGSCQFKYQRVLTGVCLFAYNRGNYASRAAVAPVFTEINTLPCAEIQTAVSYGYAETHA